MRIGGWLWFALIVGALAAPASAQEAVSPGPLAALEVLAGKSWSAQGEGYATALSYQWLQPGHVLEATNEVTSPDGGVIARYSAAYAWDAGREEIVFFTASGNGEVHRGRAWWADGVLWHEAEVSGGSLRAYASAIRPGENGFEYFADYGAATATPALLTGTPLTYTEVAGHGLTGERFIVLLKLRNDLCPRYEATGVWPDDPEAKAALLGHVTYWSEQFDRGTVVLTGGMGGDYWDNVALIVLNVADRAEADALIAGDPAVKAFVFPAQVRPFTVASVAVSP
jgi:hypothetical protein